jgi:cytochrome c oxidase subunit 1
MTLLQDRPEAAVAGAPSPPAPAVATETWLDTSDHKRLGLLFICASLLFVVGGGVLGLVGGLQQTAPGVGLGADAWLRLYGLHTQMTVLLFLTPIWIGLAAYVVPLQIGAGRVALPRLLAIGFWLYLVGGGIFIASFIVGPVNGATIVSSTPVAAMHGGANAATNLWIVSLAVISLAFLLALASLFTTIVTLRTEGMTLLRVPAFSWATLVAGAVFFVATPIFLAGLLLFGLDEHFGGTLFAPTTVGSVSIWQHTLWLYGRPDVYLLTVFAIGAATDVVATHARRPLLDHRVAVGALSAIGALSLTSLAAGDSVTHAVIVPTYTALTALVVIPIGVMILLWLGTTGRGRPRFHVSLLYVVGAILLWALGAANVIAAAIRGVDGLRGDSAWIAGNAHAVVFGPPTLLAVGALYHWGPKMWGRRLNAGMGSLAWLLLLVGFACSGMGYYLLGYNGTPLGLVADATSYQKALYGLAEGGGALVALGVIVLIVDLVVSVVARRSPVVGGDPYQGLTLEWATTSPPPRWGFDSVPEVRSEAPLFWARQWDAGPGGGAELVPSGGPAPAAIERGAGR